MEKDMTTAAWNVLAPHIRAALTTVKTEHCQPPEFRPAADIRAAMACPKCKGRLNFTVSHTSGLSTGRCSSSGCVQWSNQ